MRAALFHKAHQPLAIEDIDVDDPGPNEVLIKTAATGVCHSDLHFVDGALPYPLDIPMVLGHEGAGTVEAVGDGVTEFKVEDHVVACLSGFCGQCEQCLVGRPNLCAQRYVSRPNTSPPRLSRQGSRVNQFADIGSFAEHMLCHQNSIVRVDEDLPLDKVALMGCGVLTGLGAALRTSGLAAGQTVAVFGCGGVGLAIVQGARIGGARTIIALDQFDSKLAMAMSLGATHRINSSDNDAVAAVRELTDGRGVDHSFEAVGLTSLVRQSIEVLAIGGTSTIVGVLPAGATIEFPAAAIRPECKVQTSRMGSNRFKLDIPNYLEFYRQGRLDLDAMVSRTGPLDDINEAFRAMKAGEVARTVLVF